MAEICNYSPSNCRCLSNSTVASKHCSAVMNNMNTYRKENIYTDVVLSSGSRVFPAHRAVLAASSPYFQAMFEFRSCSESNKELLDASRPISVNMLDDDIVEDILSYMYTGYVKIRTKDIAQKLIRAADFLLLDDVKMEAAKFLEAYISISSCLNLRAFADKYCCKRLEKKCNDFIHKNFQEVAKTETFLRLNAEKVHQLISHEDITVGCEEDVFDILVSWVNYDLARRKESFSKLFMNICLPLFVSNYRLEEVGKEELVRSNEICMNWYEKARTYKISSTGPNFKLPIEFPRELRRYVWKSRGDVLDSIFVSGPSEKQNQTICGFYMPCTQDWLSVDCASIPRFGHALAFHEGLLYLVGGYSGVDIDSLSSYEVYDPVVGLWSNLGSLNRKVSRLGMCVLNNCLYAVGGYNFRNWTSLSIVQRYRSELDKWETVTPLQISREAPCVVSCSGHVFAIGGFSVDVNYLSSTERYDESTDSWTLVASMSCSRHRASGTVLDEKIYICGGCNESGTLNSCEMYNPLTDNWTVITNCHVARFGAGIAVIEDKIFLLGGWGTGSHLEGIECYLESIECYDSIKGTWSVVGSLPRHVASPKCCYVRMPRSVFLSLKMRQ